MIKTPNAGSTAREGILGRRKRLLPEPAIFVTIWRKDENGHFEQARIPLSEARKIAGATVGAGRRNDPLQVQHFRGSPGQSEGTDPRGKRLPRCRYCGAASTGLWGAPQICTGCEKPRDRPEPQTTSPGIADKMRADPTLAWSQARDSEMWIGDDALYLRVQRTLANRERLAAAEKVDKHGSGRLEHEGPAVKVSEAVAEAQRAARAKFHHQRDEAAEAAA